ncbi:transglycosylase domain-containing protein [Microlunatus soli]|uniref:Membrane carboxypeptidase (Penicillin-binding protein) n=1 Tax=Microlunatus soli TaxID=630515 RepID=A0A1H1UAM1_9ACTN|nr:transglycosylase domain-containing protein [Microlunatus soli]SDS69361.1 Membrane carboxypeptidase (penicillin-binding protein) [Microlunatus soli]
MAERPRGPRTSASSKSRTPSARRKTDAKGASAATRAPKGGKKGKKKLTPGRVIRRIALTLLTLIVVGGLASAAFVVISYQNLKLPDPNAAFTTNTSNIYYDDGKTKLGDIEVQNRQSIRYDEMPTSIKNATVAAENNTFWTDPGYSVQGMIRAAVNIARGGDLQGGSTITQQYIKIMYLSQDQTITRKFKEVLLSRKLSEKMSKQEILTGYLNTIYFGRGAYGIQAASKAYFDIDAKDLTIPQSAVLAAVLNNPAYLDPDANGGDTEPLLNRYRYVLGSMRHSGFISQAEYTKDVKKLPTLPKIKISDKYGGSKGFLMKAAEAELATLPIDQAKVRGGGYKITTTFDEKAQKAAVKAAESNTKEAAELSGHKASKLHAAIASVDVNTGAVLAMYGGPDYIENSRNWATTPRATASTFKPFALAAGLENGFSLYSQFNGNTFTPPGDGVPIRNEFSTQYGQVSLLKATAESINTAFVDLDTQLPGDGPQKVVDIAQKLGAIKEKGAQDWDVNNRVAIGSAQVSPVNMANAYATFANNGEYVQNHVIAEIKDNNGKIVYKAEPKTHRAISKDVSADVSYALQGVVKDGTGSAAQSLGRPVAGKTGTQGVDDKITSAWFTGYTKQIATSVMYVAGDGGTENLDKYKRPYDPTFFGSSYPLQTWVDYMEKATEGQKIRDFRQPAYVNRDKFPPPVIKKSAPPKQTSGTDNSDNNDKPEKKTQKQDKKSDKTEDKSSDKSNDDKSSDKSSDDKSNDDKGQSDNKSSDSGGSDKKSSDSGRTDDTTSDDTKSGDGSSGDKKTSDGSGSGDKKKSDSTKSDSTTSDSTTSGSDSTSTDTTKTSSSTGSN